MHVLLDLALAAAVAVVLGVAYMTVAVNLAANHQDTIDDVPPIGDDPSAFLRALHGAAGEACTAGNEVTLYQNGDEIFPPMLEAIAASRSTVHFTSYILWSGAIADRFIDAFCAAARRGVAVRLAVDSEGSHSRLRREDIDRLRDAGCRLAWFRPANWLDVTQYDHRTHRRILVVDGVVAFTGGAGIADLWHGDAAAPDQWRDTHARVTGPAVEALQAGFTDTWNLCTSELLLHERDYPPVTTAGGMRVTPIVSTPAGGSSPAQRTVAACIAAATSSLRITNAYFVPTPAFVDALCAARARGVSVSVITPGPYHNKPLVRRASRHTWPRLLAGGVALHEFQPTMVHAKTIVVDDAVVLVGSINFDPRSFSLNAECGVLVADAGLAARVTAAFEADLARSKRIDDAVMRGRTVMTRVVDAFCYWWRAQL